MLGDQLGHHKHRDFPLASKDPGQFIVGIDHATIDAVLKTVTFDVSPDFLGDFGPGDRLGANHRTQVGRECHGAHERGTGFTF